MKAIAIAFGVVMNYKIIRGMAIGVLANGIANYATFHSIQPINIVIGLVAGGILGYLFP